MSRPDPLPLPLDVLPEQVRRFCDPSAKAAARAKTRRAVSTKR